MSGKDLAVADIPKEHRAFAIAKWSREISWLRDRERDSQEHAQIVVLEREITVRQELIAAIEALP